ncbi:MAG: type II and III secretion system protein, partial [Planctomycetota bacterium]|nr:type II and III secretion system protein [Planctomycetota bacterium]
STVQSNFEQVTAGITLTVSPTISAGNYLKLNVEVEVSSFTPAAGTSSTGASPPPDKSTRLVNTPVTIPDGHTVVLGGLISEDNQTTEKKTPWLADLPGIGWMFRANEDTNQNTYLYIFITPHIIDSDFALLDEITDLRKREAIKLSGDLPISFSTDLNYPGDAGAVQEISEALESVFSIPTPAFPPAGEMGGDTPHVETTPANTPPLPAPESEVPSFDEIFGVDTDN